MWPLLLAVDQPPRLSVAPAKIRLMTGAMATQVLSFFPIVVAALGLLWAVMSWRRSGPSLRVHCLAYGDVIVIRVFNAGRVADRVEHVVLGGMRGGRAGFDLSPHLDLPVRLEPGESQRWRLNARAAEIAHISKRIKDGWASLWLLTGSMRQHRVEAVPVYGNAPPQVGWKLVPRRVHVMRYLPAVGAIVALLVAVMAPTPPSAWLLGIFTLVVGCRTLVVIGGSRPFLRQRVERWTLAAVWAIGIIVYLRSATRLPAEALPLLDTALIVLALVAGWLVAVPGAAASALDALGSFKTWASAARARAIRLTRPISRLVRR